MKNKSLLLIYDDLCPLCTWYTGWFVKAGFLSVDSRKAFSTVKESILRKIDFDRSKNEIPLVNQQTNQVWYGIDALFEILDQKIPFIKSIASASPIKWFLLKLYKLISFNRKAGKYARDYCHPVAITTDVFGPFYRAFNLVHRYISTYGHHPDRQGIFSKNALCWHDQKIQICSSHQPYLPRLFSWFFACASLDILVNLRKLI